MERLTTQNLHYKRILDRQLSEIDTKQRLNEAKRLREVRNLGVDLTKLQKSTRDLDEIFSLSLNDTPRVTPRRASFSEYSNSPRPLTSSALIPGRRNSVTAASLLSRSRQELASLSPTPSPNSTQQNVFDFKLTANRRSTLPEISNIIYVNKTKNHNNNNNNNNPIDNNGNRTRSLSVGDTCPNSNHSNGDNYIPKIIVAGSQHNDSLNNNNNSSRQRKISLDNSNSSVTPLATNKNITTISAMTKEGDRRKSTSSLKTDMLSSSPPSSLSTSPSSKSQAHIQPRRGSKPSVTGTTHTGSSDVTKQTKKADDNGKKLSPSRAGRRGSADSSSPSSVKGRKMSNGNPEVSRNETIVCIHRDEEDEATPMSPEPSAEGSMFSRKTRRSSEPAIGSLFLRDLQGNVVEDESKIKRNGHNSPLMKSITQGLPSGIVAEEDEDRYNKEIEDSIKRESNSVSENGGEDGAKAKQTETNIENGETAEKLSKLSLQDNGREGENQSPTSSETSATSLSKKKSAQNKEGKTTSSKKAEGDTKRSQARRKSDGDVLLKFGRIWRLHATNKGSLKELLEGKDEEAPPPPPDTKDAIWDAVRKCRYIRGYNPPDMKEQSDLRDYVFGDQP